MPQLARTAELLILSALEASTSQAYAAAFRSWCTFCGLFPVEVDPWNMNEQLLCLFAAWHFRKNNKAATVKSYVTGISSTLRRAGRSVDISTYYLFEQCIHGYKKLSPNQDKRIRLPITVAILIRIKKHVNLQDQILAVMWAIMVLAVFGMLRLGEITAKTAGSQDFPRQKDFSMNNDSKLVMRLPKSKTDPFRKGVDVKFAASGGEVCPLDVIVPAAASWTEKTAEEPAFQNADGTPITRNQIVSFLRSLLAKEGYNPDQYSGHSFRKGGAQSAYDAGIPIHDIKVLGRWRSWCFALYMNITTQKHSEYAKRMAGAPLTKPLDVHATF
jgi:hypothetical protein